MNSPTAEHALGVPGTGSGRPRDASGAVPARALAAVVLAGIAVTALSAAIVIGSGQPADPVARAIKAATNWVTIVAGLIGWRARPANRVGPLLVVLGFLGFEDSLTWAIRNGFVYTVGDMLLSLGSVVLAHLYLAFPAGRTTGRARMLTIAIYAWFLVTAAGSRLLRPYPASWGIENPFLVFPAPALSDAIGTIGNVGAVVLVVLVVGIVINRWRVGSPAARRALAPVFWASPVTLVVYGAFYLGEATGSQALKDVSTGPLAQLSGVLLPTAFLVGLLQTRLQRASIADLVRDLDRVPTGGLEDALRRALGDPRLRLAFPSGEDASFVDPAGRPLDLDATDPSAARYRIEGADDRLLAVLLHDPEIDGDLVETAAAASRLALENERLAAALRAQLEEVRASRARIVEAGDEERRRLERDLHDGAQQRLVALGFTLRAAARRADGDPELARLLDDATGELEDGLRELRSIARGIHATSLAEAGLATAVRDLADRLPLPVAIDVTGDRFDRRVETAAYYIVAESLTNVLRHAGATRATVRGRVEDGALVVEVADDGRGGASIDAGSGIRGLQDRAAAIGGSLEVRSEAGTGTTVRATLPIA